MIPVTGEVGFVSQGPTFTFKPQRSPGVLEEVIQLGGIHRLAKLECVALALGSGFLWLFAFRTPTS